MRIQKQCLPVARTASDAAWNSTGVQPSFLGNIACKLCRGACNLVPTGIGKRLCRLACDKTVCR